MKYIVGFEQDIPPYKMLEADSVEEATCMVEEYINVHPTDAYITTAPVEEPKVAMDVATVFGRGILKNACYCKKHYQ